MWPSRGWRASVGGQTLSGTGRARIAVATDIARPDVACGANDRLILPTAGGFSRNLQRLGG
jgi:hypothetical protein